MNDGSTGAAGGIDFKENLKLAKEAYPVTRASKSVSLILWPHGAARICVLVRPVDHVAP